MTGHAVLSLSYRQVCVLPLESPGAQRPGPTLANHNIYPHQATEQGACDGGPLQGQVRVPWLPEDPHLQKVEIC